jgi:hypothetical protein
VKVLVTIRPKFPIPPDQLGQMIQGFVAWRERYRSKMESFYFYAGKGGGAGVVNAADEAELSQMMLEWPFTFFSDIDIEPVVDGDVGLIQLQAVVQAMAGGGR